jgi:hypothetical protein
LVAPVALALALPLLPPVQLTLFNTVAVTTMFDPVFPTTTEHVDVQPLASVTNTV